ncbi:hypothetical protein B484DRAFT_153445 [Ochromonadaceae sp. CCMP2298]|nr:hypothetical protein B484DRAFT_153445 [Ochromonadaceae sp. CCMP2298]
MRRVKCVSDIHYTQLSYIYTILYIIHNHYTIIIYEYTLFSIIIYNYCIHIHPNIHTSTCTSEYTYTLLYILYSTILSLSATPYILLLFPPPHPLSQQGIFAKYLQIECTGVLTPVTPDRYSSVV